MSQHNLSQLMRTPLIREPKASTQLQRTIWSLPMLLLVFLLVMLGAELWLQEAWSPVATVAHHGLWHWNNLTYAMLIPAPAALIIWLGWLSWPKPKSRPHAVAFLQPLFIRYVTRGINNEALNASLDDARQLIKYWRLENYVHLQVVSDIPVDVPEDVDIIVVPEHYHTPHESLYKARALTYLQKVRPLEDSSWALYLDEESRITQSTLYGAATYMNRYQASPSAPIGQGSILYQGGPWFLQGADALRTADDLGRFYLQYQWGIPIFGIHGSFILVRADSDRAASFDVGPENSITEDAAWALKAWQDGQRFGWIDGWVIEQPPARIRDFIKQRQRWLSGIKRVIRDRSLAWRYRIVLFVFAYLWQWSFLVIAITVWE
ncbi:MAG: glycosyltransferase family 2 protein, partial [Firmicutes bacterium]|nr:glycosyltransferase family 2 protein [Bacillota bacterium]